MIDKYDEVKRVTSRKIAAEMGVSQSYSYRILIATYGTWQKIGKTQKLTPQQELRRVFMADKLLYEGELLWGPRYMDRIIFSDEAWVELQPTNLGRVGSYGHKISVETVKNPLKASFFRLSSFYT
jgi:hypothetical protein